MSAFDKIQAEELVNEEDKVLKIPHKCFCCRDTGLVKSQFIHRYVDNYNSNSKPFICHNCEVGDKFANAYCANDETRKAVVSDTGRQYAEITPQKLYQAQFDIRLNLFACNRMHIDEFELWKNEEYQRINVKKNIQSLVNNLAMPEYNENMEVFEGVKL